MVYGEIPPIFISIKLSHIFPDQWKWLPQRSLDCSPDTHYYLHLVKDCFHFLVIDPAQILMKALNLFLKKLIKKKENKTKNQKINKQTNKDYNPKYKYSFRDSEDKAYFNLDTRLKISDLVWIVREKFLFHPN